MELLFRSELIPSSITRPKPSTTSRSDCNSAFPDRLEAPASRSTIPEFSFGSMPRIRKARTCPPTAIQRCSRMSLTMLRGLPPTGFEIQIDENAAPDGADKHRTGAVYNVPTGPDGLQNFTAAALLNVGDWNDMEITVKNHLYTVSINNSQTTDFIN